ncbi:MAG: DNRLRE domain-containing protein [Actinomycetota bacterium]
MRASQAVTSRRILGLVVALVASLTSSIPTSAATPEVVVAFPPPAAPSEEQRELVDAPGGDYGKEEPRPLPMLDGKSPQAILDRLEGRTAVSAIETVHRFDSGPFAGTEHVAEVTSGPANFLDASGNWRRIDPTLVPVEGGYRNGAGPFTVFFPTSPTERTPIGLSLPEGELLLSLDSASPGLAVSAQDNALIYAGALEDTDFVFTVGYEGFKEEIVLKSRSAPATVSFLLAATGLTLRSEADGAISVLSGEETIGVFPAPWVQDSAIDPIKGEGASGPVTQTLADLGGSRYRIEVAVDKEWLASPARIFPVIIDPTNVTKFPSRDAYVSEVFPGTNYGTSTELRIGSYNGDGSATHHSYVSFDISALKDSNRQVYDAQFMMYNFHSGSGSATTEAVRRVDGSWFETGITWNNRPAVGSTDWAAPSGCGANYSCDPWHSWQLWDLFEVWIQDTQPNQGLRLHGPSPHPQSYKKFYSDEQPDIGGVDVRPRTYITYNDPPTMASLNLPGGQAIIETESPTLKIVSSPKVTDPNDDDVYMKYELSLTQDFAAIELNSGWLEKTYSWVVPAGSLKDGQTYYWRVKTSDLLTMPGRHPDPIVQTSGQRHFTVALKKWGEDERWAMWRTSLGNGMSMAVNEANGNLYLDYPLDSLTTPVGPLDLRLTYNSQQTSDSDFGEGWNISAGPGQDDSARPTKLTEPSYGGALIKLANGNKLYFPHIAGRRYGSVGQGAGLVTKGGTDASPSWVYRSPTGGRYRFDDAGKLTSGKGSTDDWSKPGFDFFYDGGGKLERIRDPLLREVTITWVSGRPTCIHAWTGWEWKLTTDGTTGNLLEVTEPATGSTCAAPAAGAPKVKFSYLGTDLTKIRDGETYASPDADATQITYQELIQGKPPQVKEVFLPGQTAPTSFSFRGGWTGSIAGGLDVEDPRGPGTPGDAFDYETQIDFNIAGLPIQISGPRDQNGMWPKTTMLWDTNGNLVCKRTPAQNAVRTGCNDPANPTIPLGHGQADGLQTDYTYQTRAPFLVKTETGSAPNADGSGARALTTYAYDEDSGAPWAELYAEYFTNTSLSGMPAGAGFQSSLDKDWQSGAPQSLEELTPPVTNNWTMRLTGRITFAEEGKYQFRVTTDADAGVRLVVGSYQVLDCWADTTPCEGEDEHYKYYPSTKDFALEYVERTDNARLKLEWDGGPANQWAVLPISITKPDMNLLATAADLLGTTTYTYGPGDKAKRRLTSETRAGRTTTYSYDDFGRVKLLTDPRGKATTYEYGGPTNSGPCLTKQIDRTGAETRYQCNDAGDVTRTEQVVRQVLDPDTSQEIQPAQTRVIETTYDPLGRVDLIKVHIGGQIKTITDNDYDKAGRLRFTRDVVLNETEYLYDLLGRVTEEWLPDPNGLSENPPRPVIKHEYDPVGNETVLTDANNKKWTRAYDALNRLTSSKDPYCAVGETYHDPAQCAETTTNYDVVQSKVTVTDPHGVQAVTTFDLLGRKVSEKLGTYQPTTYQYDPIGNVTKVTDTAGVWVETTYNPFSQPLTEKTRSGPGGAETTTTNAYDSGGRLESVNGPRPIQQSQDDVVSYVYDDEGRLTQVTLPHSGPNVTAYLYDDAGELLRVKDAEGRRRTFVYDERGRQTTGMVWKGATPLTTTSHYDDLSRLTKVVLPTDAPVDEQWFEYDNLGRRTRRYGLNGQTVHADERFAYDPAGNLTEAKDAGGQRIVFLAYEHAGRLESVTATETVPDPDRVVTTTHAYNKGRLASRTDPAGATSFAYNANGLVDTLTLPPGFGATVTYGYDSSSGRPTTRSVATGQTTLHTVRTYEGASGRIDTQVTRRGTGPTDPLVASFDLDYDEADNVTRKTVQVTGYPAGENGAWDYHYDQAGRMDWAEDPQEVRTTYTWDGAGNRTSVQTGTQPAVTTTYDGAGFPDSASDGTDYTTDDLGSLKQVTKAGQTTTYTYDAWNRLETATTPQGTVDYILDALDRTASRTEGATTTTFDYVGTSEDPARATEGTSETTYGWSPSEPVAQVTGSAKRFLIRELHQDVVALVDAAGTTSGTSAYSPWGEVRSASGDPSRLGYQSDPTDPRTGLVDMLTRQYAPGIGRFTTRDSLFGELSIPLSLNQFVYGLNDPISNVDPTGLCADPAICPPMTGHGKGKHNKEFRSRIDETSALNDKVWSEGVPYEYEPAPPPASPRIPHATLQRNDPDLATPGEFLSPISGEPNFWDSLGSLVGDFSVEGGAHKIGCGKHIECYENVEWLEGIPAKGLTIGHTILCQRECVPDLLRHEKVHVVQFEEYGPVYPILYLGTGLIMGGDFGCDHPLEQPAYRVEGKRC